jgi:hypothetical protein
MPKNERRIHSPLFAYLFFILEVVIILELLYLATTIFGFTQIAVALYSITTAITLFNAIIRLKKVLQRSYFLQHYFERKN